jgi:diaminohydroxyphosphoribosylaminopyrimidine deaminase/5-amino-6-(5-phosphoribosylamino)uracil reductase
MSASSLWQSQKEKFMLQAVELAQKGKGYTAPNPCVGALLVRDGKTVSQGWHARYGQPHAEVNAINACKEKGEDPAKCSLFVTLEPCNHQGKTPPCTQAILNAGIKEVFVGTEDPNKNVAGGGIEFLRSQGLEVQCPIAEQACLDLIRDFRLWNTEKRAYVYLKLAATLDGKIATRSGNPAWISSVASREEVHRLRSRVQAILIGRKTLEADNPQLTARLEENISSTTQPLAIVVCKELPLDPARFQLIQERPEQVIFWSTEKAAKSNEAEFLRQKGCKIWPLPTTQNDALNLKTGLYRLFNELNIYYLLCEGGGILAMQLFEQSVADELWYFLAPLVLGDDQAMPAFSGKKVDSINKALPLRLIQQQTFGQDLLLKYMPHKPLGA